MSREHARNSQNQISCNSSLPEDDLEEDHVPIQNQQGRHGVISMCNIATSHSTYPSSSPHVKAEDIGPKLNLHEIYKSESKRLETFKDWPSSSAVKKEDLARNGFIYLHVDDRTQCVFCRSVLSKWATGDVVENEHKTHCPECMFAYGLNTCGNVPIICQESQAPISHGNFSNQMRRGETYNTADADYFQAVTHNSSRMNAMSQGQAMIAGNAASTPNITHMNNPSFSGMGQYIESNTTPESSNEPKFKQWSDERVRVMSFRGWPPNMAQTPITLAQAGLVYMGTDDRCKCFWCGGELYDWEPSDNPWEEHAKWFGHCGFVRQKMSPAFIQFVKDKQNGLIEDTTPMLMRHPHVLAVLQNGYTIHEVQQIVNKYGVLSAPAIIQAIENMKKENLELVNQRNRSVSGMQEMLGASSVYPVEDVEMHAMEAEEHKKLPKTSDQLSRLEPKATSATGKDVDKVLEEVESLRDMKLCKICMDRELCITFIPCGHLATCEECSVSLLECPICRKPIALKQKIYWS